MRRVVCGDVIQVGAGDGKNAPLGEPLFDLCDSIGFLVQIPLAEKLKRFHGKSVRITIETVPARRLKQCAS
jgi:hypothetical protein